MNLPQLRVFNFAVIRGFMPLGVAQLYGVAKLTADSIVIRGFMPLGVAQSHISHIKVGLKSVIRGFMPLGVAQWRYTREVFQNTT